MMRGAIKSMWSFDTEHDFEEIQDPGFLRGFTHAVRVGDQVLFSCGTGHRVHGIMAVLRVSPAQGGGAGEPSWGPEVQVAILSKVP
jgi:hypothetical protein